MGAFVFVFGAIFGLISAAFVPAADPGSRLLQTVGAETYMITSPSSTSSGGTGFSLRAPSGTVYTVTNAHVCEVAENGFVAVHTNDGSSRFVLKIIEVSRTTDLCLIESVPGATGLEMATYIDPFAAVYAIGHPFLEPNTLSRGYVTGCRELQIQKNFFETVTVYGCLTSALIFPGNSGSAAVDESGHVVGVFFAGDSRSNYGSFVPLRDLLSFVATR
jgi:S1-C subfamily serine protease